MKQYKERFVQETKNKYKYVYKTPTMCAMRPR